MPSKPRLLYEVMFSKLPQREERERERGKRESEGGEKRERGGGRGRGLVVGTLSPEALPVMGTLFNQKEEGGEGGGYTTLSSTLLQGVATLLLTVCSTW